MTDKPVFPQIPEVGYLSDHFVSERVNAEQKLFAGYRQPRDGNPMFAGAGKEGSWINSRHNPENAGK